MILKGRAIDKDIKTHLLLIAGLVFSIYANTLFFDFCIDDLYLIVNNEFVKDIRNLPGLFKATYFVDTWELSYRPVETLSFFLDYHLFQLNPFGYHLHNVILGTVNCLLLYLLVYIISGNPKIALFSSLIFTVHPTHSEPLSVVNYRDDLQVVFFMFVTFLLYLGARRKNSPTILRRSCFGISLVSMLLTLLSKESAITIVGFLFLYEYTFAKGSLWQSLKKAPPYILLTILYLAARFTWLMNPLEKRVVWPLPTLADRLQVLPKVFAIQLWQLFIPYPLYSYYEIQSPGTFMRLDIGAFYFLIFVIAVMYFVLFFGRRKSSLEIYATFCIGWILLSMIPVSNIYPLAWPHVEKYLYLPSVGVSILLGYIMWKYYKKKEGAQNKRNPAAYLLASMVLLMAVYCASRNYTWRNNITYWTAASCRYKSPAVYYNLGTSLINANRLNEAENWLKSAIAIQPNNPKAFCNLGSIYLDSGNSEKGLAYYKKALELDNNLYEAALGVALCSFVQKDFCNARRYCQMAIELNPHDDSSKKLLQHIKSQTHSK